MTNLHPKLVEVAVGVTVENMSTIALSHPPALRLEELDERDADELSVLIGLRRVDGELGGHWELPGGKIEANESAEACVRREFIEEVGVVIEPMLRLPTLEHQYDHARVRLMPFLCRRVSGIARAIEVDEVRWVLAEELAGFTFPPANAPLLKMIRGIVGRLSGQTIGQLLEIEGVSHC